MAIISKERFCEIMDELVAERDTAREMDNLLAANRTMKDMRDFFSANCLHMAHEPLVLELLGVMFDDSSELIEYWMYEMDFGREWFEGCMTDEESNPVMLCDAASLYDYLTQVAV